MVSIIYSLTKDRMNLINEKLMLETMKLDEPRGFKLDTKLNTIHHKINCLDVAINALTSYEALSFHDSLYKDKDSL